MSDINATKGPWKWKRIGNDWVLWGEHGDRPIVMLFPVRGGTRLRKNGLLTKFDPTHPDAQLIQQAPTMAARIEELEAKLASIESLADGEKVEDLITAAKRKMALTANKVRVGPLDKVWANVSDFAGPVECEVGAQGDSAWYEVGDDDVQGPDVAWLSVSRCYSTSEAAKAARLSLMPDA